MLPALKTRTIRARHLSEGLLIETRASLEGLRLFHLNLSTFTLSSFDTASSISILWAPSWRNLSCAGRPVNSSTDCVSFVFSSIQSRTRAQASGAIPKNANPDCQAADPQTHASRPMRVSSDT